MNEAADRRSGRKLRAICRAMGMLSRKFQVPESRTTDISSIGAISPTWPELGANVEMTIPRPEAVMA
jgi:hypothetical protein